MHFNNSITLLFAQLCDALKQLDDNMYAKKLPVILNASIGEHVRHIVEHFDELNKGYEQGIINYGKRKRDFMIETKSKVAVDAMQNIISGLHKLDKTLLLCVEGHSPENTQVVTTTYARELYYNQEHAVHHMALIRVAISNITAIALPDSFGVAASTIIHRKACAQ